MPSTFILVDDCEIDRYLARRTIRKSGYEQEIVEFSDGAGMLELLNDAEKLAEFRNTWPDPYLVILDINMPRVGGFEVAEALVDWARQDENLCSFEVLMLTSSSNERDRRRAEECEVIRDFATKPLTPEILIRTVSGCSLGWGS